MAFFHLLVLGLACDWLAFAIAEPKVVFLKTSRIESTDVEIAARNSIPVPISNKGWYYTVNASIGTPPQNVSFLLDTGSSDTWMPTPDACHGSILCDNITCKPVVSDSHNVFASRRLACLCILLQSCRPISLLTLAYLHAIQLTHPDRRHYPSFNRMVLSPSMATIHMLLAIL